MFWALPAYCETVFYGNAEYTVDSAREAVIKDVIFKINPKIFSDKIYDLENEKNLQNILDGNFSQKDRTLAFFSDSSYGVMFSDNPYYVYYYNPEGFLIYIDQKSSLEYPYNFYKYSAAGELVNMGLRVSKEETYIYSPSKKLIAHWVGNNAYDQNNNIIMKRAYSD